MSLHWWLHPVHSVLYRVLIVYIYSSFLESSSPFTLRSWEKHEASVILVYCVHVSQSVNFTFFSHLGLIRCLTLIVRVSTLHQMFPSSYEAALRLRTFHRPNLALASQEGRRRDGLRNV
jgi:hypothetical protein